MSAATKAAAAALAACALLCGCTTATLTAKVTTTDPKTGLVEVRDVQSRIHSAGDAKSAVELVKASASAKTASVGANGVSQESNLSDLVNAAANLLGQVFQAGVAAGKAAK